MEISKVHGARSVAKAPEQVPANKEKLKIGEMQSLSGEKKDGEQDPQFLRQEKAVKKAASIEEVQAAVEANKGFGFQMVGADSRLEELDISREITDLKKDEILQQYHYFVKNAKKMLIKDEDWDSFYI